MMRKDVVVGAMALLALLGGCTDAEWTRATSFVGIEPSAPTQLRQEEPAEQPQPVFVAAQEDKADSWCRTVAQRDAAHNAFDAKTRQEILQQSYNQCLAIFGPPDTR
jgi:hypothetical protein